MKMFKVARTFLWDSAIVVAAVTATLLVCEFAVRHYPVGIFATFTEKSYSSQEMFVPDPLTGHRPNPLYPGHDKRGWRNEAALDKADIVVLGDSQTYGLNAKIENAWPQVVGKTLNRSVYQMAFGGFGPSHYVQLLDEALSLSPKTVVVALYFGNDILDSYWLTYPVKDLEFQRSKNGATLDSFISDDPKILTRLQRLEEIDPFHRRHSFLDCQSPRFIDDPLIQEVEALDRLPMPPQDEIDEKNFNLRIRKWSARSWLFRAAWSSWGNLIQSPRPARSSPSHGGTEQPPPYGPPVCLKVASGPLQTELSPAYRLVTLIESDLRVVEGERISMLSLLDIAKRLKRRDVDFKLVMIPTKELVIKPFFDSSSYSESDLRYLHRLWRLEEAMRDRMGAELRKNGVEIVDALPYLRKSISDNSKPYPADADGHPNEAGYRAIAEAVATDLAHSKGLAGK